MISTMPYLRDSGSTSDISKITKLISTNSNKKNNQNKKNTKKENNTNQNKNNHLKKKKDEYCGHPGNAKGLRGRSLLETTQRPCSVALFSDAPTLRVWASWP